MNAFTLEDTAILRGIQAAKSTWKSWLPLLLGAVMTIGGGLMAFGHKQGQKQATDEELIRKVDGIAADVRSVQYTLQSHGERLAGLEATSQMTQNDVHDLKALADHASDVAEQFKIPRLTGHRARH